MHKQEQAILARDMIDMIRDYPDNADVLEYLDSFATSIAEIVNDQSVIDWYDIAGVCDQRFFSLRQGNPVPLNLEILEKCDKQLQKYLPMAKTSEH